MEKETMNLKESKDSCVGGKERGKCDYIIIAKIK